MIPKFSSYFIICTTSEMFWSCPFPHVFAIPTCSSEVLFTSNTSDYYHHIPGSEKKWSGFLLNLLEYAETKINTSKNDDFTACLSNFLYQVLTNI